MSYLPWNNNNINVLIPKGKEDVSFWISAGVDCFVLSAEESPGRWVSENNGVVFSFTAGPW